MDLDFLGNGSADRSVDISGKLTTKNQSWNLTRWGSDERSFSQRLWKTCVLVISTLVLTSLMTWGVAKHRAWVSTRSVNATHMGPGANWAASFWVW